MRAIITALFLILFSQSALANYEEFFNKVPKGSIMCDNIEWFSDHPEAAAIVENGRYFSIMFPEKLKKLKIDEVVFRIDFGNLGEGYGTYMSRLKDGTLAPSSV